MMRIAAAALVCGVAGVLALPATTAAQDRFSAPEREEIGEIVREYLLSNPDILEDMIAELEERDARDQEASRTAAIHDNAERLFRSPRTYVAGNPDGDVTVVEFFDYNCGYCRRMVPDMIEMVETDPDLRLVLREWPILGPASMEAARVAVAVLETAPDSYFDFHVELMSENGQVGSDEALEVASRMGLDVAQIEAAAAEPDVEETLRESLELGATLDLRGTPAYVVDDSVMMGAVGGDRLAESVAVVREEGCKAC